MKTPLDPRILLRYLSGSSVLELRSWIVTVSLALCAGCGAHNDNAVVSNNPLGVDAGDGCTLVCARLATAGCASLRPACLSLCIAEAAAAPQSCASEFQDVISCDESGAITCNSMGNPSVDSCVGPALALASCEGAHGVDAGVTITTNSLYGACTLGTSCPDGTACASAQLSTDNGHVCTSPCATTSDCFVVPGDIQTPVCVHPPGAMTGQCYFGCTTGNVCAPGTTANTSTGMCVCVP